MTLTEFLLARIAEDEATADAATSGPWTVEPYWFDRGPRIGDVLTGPNERLVRDVDLADAEHIARHDPARVLSECEAKRRLIDDFRVLDADYRVTRSAESEARRFQALVAVGQVAIIYADHPDYDDKWRP